MDKNQKIFSNHIDKFKVAFVLSGEMKVKSKPGSLSCYKDCDEQPYFRKEGGN